MRPKAVGGAARQLTEQGLRRRESLLDAAEHVLVEVGNAQSSMRDIADRAGVRLGHLQHYFPARGDLIRAVLERSMDRSLQRLATTTSQTDGENRHGANALTVGPEQLVAALLAEQDNPSLTRLYIEIWAIAARDEAVAAVTREFYHRYVGLVSEYIARRQPELSAQRCWGRARAFVGLFEGISIMISGIANTGAQYPDEEFTAIAVQILTRTSG